MERTKQKSKKDKPIRYDDKDKAATFVTDIKTIKENLKIREILRTVKMNSSMRIKAPRGSKVMQNKDFNENDDSFDEATSVDGSETAELPSAMNPDVVLYNKSIEEGDSTPPCKNLDSGSSDEIFERVDSPHMGYNNEETSNRDLLYKSNSLSQLASDYVEKDTDSISNVLILPVINIHESPVENSYGKTRDRKLSLDHTLLSRREGFSQSEMDLHSIGKSPLERKSSFFRKKMDSFLKNTTEIFKRQSFQSRSQCPKRTESMSGSLQSLNENSAYNVETYQVELQGSTNSLQSSMTAERSASSLSVNQSDRIPPDIQFDDDSLLGSQPYVVVPSSSVHSLNEHEELQVQDALLNRAISMNSGLDAAHGKDRRKALKSNRVTWVASEGLTNYFRRVIQDEKSRAMQVCHSYQDFTTIPEDKHYGKKIDSKGRRLSYQRAVSGEDPITLTKYQESSMRKKRPIPENSEINYELASTLAEFSRNGVPPLQGFNVANICNEAYACLNWIEKWHNSHDIYGTKITLSVNEEARQAVIREMVFTEADYIRHLIVIVEVFIAAAHALQCEGKLLTLDTEKLFINIPDILNANLIFWEITFYPMLMNSIEQKIPFNSELMHNGFYRFRDVFQPYERYMDNQPNALNYLRDISAIDADFVVYLGWCHSHKSCNRLQLSDILIKPMQRFTKYGLLLRRLIENTNTEPERTSVVVMEQYTTLYVTEVNRAIRRRGELMTVNNLNSLIECYDIDCKDDDLERAFRAFAKLNLKVPMLQCDPKHSRCLIYQGDVRYKDSQKEIEVRAFLFTDMLLICKKQTKGNFAYKMIRPRYMVNKTVIVPRESDSESSSLIFVSLDDHGTSHTAFSISEFSKDPTDSMKTWEQKFREAKMTYEFTVWCTKNPFRGTSEMELGSSADFGANCKSAMKQGSKQSLEDMNIEREARERVMAMLQRELGESEEVDRSLSSVPTDSVDSHMRTKFSKRPMLQRNSTGGSSRNSRLSSFQQSSSFNSHDEHQGGPSGYMNPGYTVEQRIPETKSEEGSSITVNVPSDSESDTVVSAQISGSLPVPVVVVEDQASARKVKIRSSSANRNTLPVEPQSGDLNAVHSLPDLTLESLPKMTQSHTSKSASEQLYKSHHELLQRKFFGPGQQHMLSSEHGGVITTQPGSTRTSKNPPLLRMANVQSISQIFTDPGASTSQLFKSDKSLAGLVDVKGDKKGKRGAGRSKDTRSASKKSGKRGDRRDRSESPS